MKKLRKAILFGSAFFIGSTFVVNPSHASENYNNLVIYESIDLDSYLKKELVKSGSEDIAASLNQNQYKPLAKSPKPEATEANTKSNYTEGVAGNFVQTGQKLEYYQNGNLITNSNFKVDGKVYRADENGAVTNPKNTWLQVGDNKYYNKNDGTFAKGLLKLNNGRYYFSKDGTLQKNTKLVTDYYFYEADNEGKLKIKPESWQMVDGKTYRTYKDGSLVKGPKKVDSLTYVFDSDTGAMITGRPAIAKQKYYDIDYRGVANLVKNSWVDYEGGRYFTDKDGYVLQGINEVDGKLLYFSRRGLEGPTRFMQDGIIYDVDSTGQASLAGYNYSTDKNIDTVMDFMFKAMNTHMTYDMSHLRTTANVADCSSAVYRALIYGGFLSPSTYIGTTENLFALGREGSVMYQINESEIDYGDIFVAGTPGRSLGDGGHTGFILNNRTDQIIHMNYADNGVSITRRKGKMGDKIGLPVRYYRLAGARSDRIFEDK